SGLARRGGLRRRLLRLHLVAAGLDEEDQPIALHVRLGVGAGQDEGKEPNERTTYHCRLQEVPRAKTETGSPIVYLSRRQPPSRSIEDHRERTTLEPFERTQDYIRTTSEPFSFRFFFGFFLFLFWRCSRRGSLDSESPRNNHEAGGASCGQRRSCLLSVVLVW